MERHGLIDSFRMCCPGGFRLARERLVGVDVSEERRTNVTSSWFRTQHKFLHSENIYASDINVTIREANTQRPS